jgi:hypothetical protein
MDLLINARQIGANSRLLKTDRSPCDRFFSIPPPLLWIYGPVMFTNKINRAPFSFFAKRFVRSMATRRSKIDRRDYSII